MSQYDAFADENLAAGGGGLWDGKTVTITNVSARSIKREFVNDSGQPDSFERNELVVSGIADGEEIEREETYSAGSLLPTTDGDGFRTADGRPLKLYPNAELTKFGRSIRDGGFDTTRIKVNNDTITGFGVLKGARFVFTAVQRLDKDGKPKIRKGKNGKDYPDNKFYPRQYVGSRAVGNGAVTDELKGKATAAVQQALQSAGGALSRADLVRTLSTQLNGSTDTNAIIALVIKDEFHVGQPWVREGATFRLAA